MGYNSEEEKKMAEGIAKKTEMARGFAQDEKTMKKLSTLLDKLIDAVNHLHEKSKYEPLTSKELDLLGQIQPAIIKMTQSMSDAQLLLGNDMIAKSTAYFFHLKKLTEEGNEEARKAYEHLAPSFKKAMAPDKDGPVGLN